ncbi:amidohydrolase family protein [Bdellovibrio sp. BCCA]|uniref:amidohydrolase family protein n=1 Tax=Bdellovibrio sp. BCCA TaxID=3136281 RepID=UPI0030F20F23
MIYLENAEIFQEGRFIKAHIFTAGERIKKIQAVDYHTLRDLDVKVYDCTGCFVIPGILDPHLHLAGGSGEKGGFSSQSAAITIAECVRGGVTTLVGTLGVDTTTKTMPELVARARAFNDVGLTAYCYTGGYDCPPRTITDSVRHDVIYIPEIIGVGEIAIADRRAPEPTLHDLARSMVDAYVGGMLSNKPGISHIHAGGGDRRLQTLRDLMEVHVIVPHKIHITHIGRSKALVEEAIEMAKRGCFVDLDLWDRDFVYWYKVYRDLGGPLDQLTVSSDAGIGSPSELWWELRDAVLNHGYTLEELLPHFTVNTARALGLSRKGRILVEHDADLTVIDAKNFEIKHVISRGQVFLEDGKFVFSNRMDFSRRGLDIYGIGEENDKKSS